MSQGANDEGGAKPDRLVVAGAAPCGAGTHVADLPCADGQHPACVELAKSPVFLLTLVIVTSLGPLAMSSFVPAIPAIQSDFGVSGTIAQLTLSVSIITMAVASLAYGSLADRFGRRPVLLTGIGLGFAGSVLCALGPTIELVIAGRAIQAAGASTGFVLARVIVRDVYGDARSAKVLAYVTAAMTVAPMIGPILGGYLIDGVGWRAVFVVVAAVAAALFAVVAVRLPETRPADVGRSDGSVGQSYLALLGNVGYLKFMAYGTMAQAAFFGFVAGAPYVMSEILGYPATVYGLYFAMVPFGYFAGSLLAAKFDERFTHERLTVASAVAGLAACALGLVWTAGVSVAPIALFLPAALLAVASGTALPGAQAGMLAAAGRLSGSASGLFSFIQLIISAITAQIVGALQTAGATGVFSVMVGASVLALLGYAGAASRRFAAVLDR